MTFAPLCSFIVCGFFVMVLPSVQAGADGHDKSSVLSNGGENELLFQAAIVELINSNPAAGWTAGYNPRLHGLTRGGFKRMLGAYRNPPKDVLRMKPSRHSGAPGHLRGGLKLPKYFDARRKWSRCPTIGHIRDQGHCGSCWAFGAVEVLSDRFCIHRNETVDLSAEDVVACCGVLCGDGCDGGWPYRAFQYFVLSGVVTEKCQPYFDADPQCSHPGCGPVVPTPKCVRTCEDGEAWKSSKHYAIDAYGLEQDPEAIMAEVYENGPVEVAFDVYEDFAHYKGGVYRHMYGDILGGHAVKLVGWGTTDDGVDYWTIANSWNDKWGENGYFRIVRGTNDCGIEEDVVAGTPGKPQSTLAWAASVAVE